jgi:hypothetical protein
MSTEQREMTPEEKIVALEAEIETLGRWFADMENTVYYLRQDVNAKAGGNHSHGDIERQIRDTEHHTHHQYASDRHTHDRWDMR